MLLCPREHLAPRVTVSLVLRDARLEARLPPPPPHLRALLPSLRPDGVCGHNVFEFLSLWGTCLLLSERSLLTGCCHPIFSWQQRSAQDALLPDRQDHGGAHTLPLPELECEYCFKRERELCSAMVVDLSPEEAETFLKQQEAVRQRRPGLHVF